MCRCRHENDTLLLLQDTRCISWWLNQSLLASWVHLEVFLEHFTTLALKLCCRISVVYKIKVIRCNYCWSQSAMSGKAFMDTPTFLTDVHQYDILLWESIVSTADLDIPVARFACYQDDFFSSRLIGNFRASAAQSVSALKQRNDQK